MSVFMGQSELVALLGRLPLVRDGYALIDCPLCDSDARWYSTDGRLECEAGCEPLEMLRALRSPASDDQDDQELLPGEPPVCSRAAFEYRHDARSCLACAVRQAWVAQEARQQITKAREASEWSPPPEYGSLADELAEELPATPWLIEGLLPVGANLLVAAEAKAGKTTLALNMARALVDGEPLFGHLGVARPSRVGWWNLELNRPSAVGWLRDMHVERPADLTALHLRGHPMPLMTSAAQAWAVRWLQQHEVDTWIVDPLGALYDGDENDNSAVRDYLKVLDQIRAQAGIGQLVVVTHTGHQAKVTDDVRTRGASVFLGWPDVLVQYRKGSKADNTADKRYLSAFGRDVELEESGLDYEPGTRSLAWAGGSRREDASTAKARQAYELVARHEGPMNTSELRAALRPGNNEVLDKAIAHAVQEGWLIKEQVNKQHYRYTVGRHPRIDFVEVRLSQEVGPPL